MAVPPTPSFPTQNPDVFAASMIGSWQWNISEDLVNCDPTNARILGLSVKDAAEGVPLWRIIEAVHPDDRDYFRQTTAPARAAGGSVSLVVRTTPSPSMVRHVIVRGHYAPDTGFGRGVLIDITDTTACVAREDRAVPIAKSDSIAGGAALCSAARDGIRENGSFRLRTLLDMTLIEFQALMKRQGRDDQSSST